ncbi:hypothetical protein GCM10010398_20470 [Streptomyces fimbriatus]
MAGDPGKDSGRAGADYATALECALRHGWIDGRGKKLDDTHRLRRFTPARDHRGRPAALIERGRMRESGLREAEGARRTAAGRRRTRAGARRRSPRPARGPGRGPGGP